jgi:hypothetical protein
MTTRRFSTGASPPSTLDKISPRSLAIVGHVILESLNALQNKLR